MIDDTCSHQGDPGSAIHGERLFSVQMHIHGSGSEGCASMLAHDRQAAAAGGVDAIWWTEHDWRLANFAMCSGFDFDEDEESVPVPARQPVDGLPPESARACWRATDGARRTARIATMSDERSYDGRRSLLVCADARGGSPCALYRLSMQGWREVIPLFSRPKIRIAVLPEDGALRDGEVLIEVQLSEQPPDCSQASIRYVASSIPMTRHCEDIALTVPIVLEEGRWNLLELDPAADAADLGLPGGGLDNALHEIRIGVRSRTGRVAASFDRLRLEPAHRGDVLRRIQHDLNRALPLQLAHFGGMEVSYYGEHINAFGSAVPIPDYERLPPSAMTTRGIVQHIHRHGGLASYNHPPVGDVEALAERLAARDADGLDLVEVAHAADDEDFLAKRLQLWDLLGSRGIALTGLGASDAHHARTGWPGGGGCAVCWITRIWATELSEAALLAALEGGRAFFADHAAFRGEIDLRGPDGLRMGGAAVTRRPMRLQARVSGARAGDRIAWICDNRVVQSDVLDRDGASAVWHAAAPQDDGVRVVRIELLRPLTDGWRRIACANPLYLLGSERAAGPRLRRRLLHSGMTKIARSHAPIEEPVP